MSEIKKKKQHWVMDYETMVNLFCAVFTSHNSDETRVFIIHKLQNDFEDFIDFLTLNKANEEWHVGFNNLGFDGQITEYILRYQNILRVLPPEKIVEAIYAKAQDVIQRQADKQFQEYPEWKLSIKSVDVFKLNHWDFYSAKSSSLKWIQFSMDWHNLQEMPIHHTTPVHTWDDINLVVDYCKNDVSSTKKIMILSKEQINLRAKLTNEYGINLYNASEPKLSKDLFLHFLSEKTGIEKRDLKSINTKRELIPVTKILLDYIKFERQEFRMLLNNFHSLTIDASKPLKGAFKYSVKYKGLKIDYGVGGLHGFGKSGKFEAKDGKIIMTSDVKSYYPNLAIKNRWAPAHLSKEIFCDQYEWFYNERTKIPKSDPRNYVYKILLNSTYGLTIEPSSMLSDPQMGMQITINGQLSLSMLLEMICERIPDAQPIMLNTDGLEVMIDEQYKDQYLAICAEWEAITKLELEHDQYSRLWAYDCNNYIAEFINGKTKCKGRFEFEAHDKYEVASLHKNKSHLIVPKAIFNYFVKGIEPRDYLVHNRNIFDYCGGVRMKGNWQLVEFHTGKDGITTRELQKTLRYYISKGGYKIVKQNKSDGRQIQIEAGATLCTEFNVYKDIPWKHYNVDDGYYLEQIYKEIRTLEPPAKTQLDLFT